MSKQSDLENSVINTICEVLKLKKEKIRQTDSLGALNVDSIGLAEMLCIIEEDYDIELDESKFNGDTTINQIIGYVENQVYGYRIRV